MPDPQTPDDRRASLVRRITSAQRRIKVHDPEEIGRAAAELHDGLGFSWPAISKLTGVPMSTLHRRARPYIKTQRTRRG